VDCGGMPVRALTAPATGTVLLRAFETYYLTAWGGGQVSAIFPGGSATTLAGMTQIFMPSEDGEAAITAAAGSAGIMLASAPLSGPYLPGNGTPCRVAVVDPGRTLKYVMTDRAPQADFEVTIKEVG